MGGNCQGAVAAGFFGEKSGINSTVRGRMEGHAFGLIRVATPESSAGLMRAGLVQPIAQDLGINAVLRRPAADG